MRGFFSKKEDEMSDFLSKKKEMDELLAKNTKSSDFLGNKFPARTKKSAPVPAVTTSEAARSKAPSGHRRNKLIAALLALFLGWLGIHKFYLGKVIQGIFYLLLFWTLSPALIALIEAILLWRMPEETFNQKYGCA